MKHPRRPHGETIAVLLVATAAHHLSDPDKLAFVRSFFPNFPIAR